VPIYEYRCPNGHTFEVFQRMTDPAVEVCEVCAAGPVEKVLFPVAVHFKGKGFYSTDYGRGSGSGAAKEGSDAGTSSKDSSSGEASGGSGVDKKTSSGDSGSGGTSKPD
jgi:putative FmdB family regulatory protein